MTTFAELAGVPVATLGSVARRKGGEDSLAAIGVTTVLDLVTHYPRRYVDRTVRAGIGALVEGSDATVVATVRTSSTRRTRNGRAMVEVDVFDGASYMRVTFFNQGWRARQLPVGVEAVFSGKVERYKGRLQMTNPLVDLIGDRTGRIVAIYPESEKAGLTSDDLSTMVADALDHVVGTLADPLPESVRTTHDLAERGWALRQTHLPDSLGAKERARRRLGFDELLRLQMILVLRKRLIEREAIGITHVVGGALIRRFLDQLPFPLTAAQQRAVAEIDTDLAGAHPMHRLLQGDVGSGKTLVAVAALLTAVDGGHQGAFMAPTEVLAEQHAASVRNLLDGLEVPAEGSLFPERALAVELLTGRMPAAARRALLARLGAGNVDILIGTHALLTETVDFADLGVVVIDEQHRFGVEQRAALRDKGNHAAVPDVLVMTATPIPRTAAMTVFGDLDTTVLDELPPGRTPITTVWARSADDEATAWAQVRAEVSRGRQAYVVCPLVEGSEKIQARSAAEEVERLAGAELAGLRLGLLHGQLAATEKEEVMAGFRRGILDVLVATTVIEVGVDVPNATVMVIEDAARFGIAQLHQLRGRVGRGADSSWCYLLGDGVTAEGAERLEALATNTDGFVLAEIDLDLRGEGTILGARQKGASDLKLASLRRHRKTVELARQVAFEIVDADPALSAHPALAEEIHFLVDDDDREYLFKS